MARVRCAFHGHWWVTSNITILDYPDSSRTEVMYFCARYCGATRTETFPTVSPDPFDPAP